MAELDNNLPPQTPEVPPVPPPAESGAAESAHTGSVDEKPRGFRRVTHALKEAGIRLYALLLVLVVVGISLVAFRSLLTFVFVPTPVPQRFLDWQGHLEASALRAENVAGITGPAARAPIGHFHRVDRWFQSDPANGCTTSGCHDPLPHRKAQKVPAFANFHATFLTCTMCHQNGGANPSWVSTSTGRTQDVPALLKLLNYLETHRDVTHDRPAEAHAAILPLLAETVTASHRDGAMATLYLQLQSSEPGSPVWRLTVDRLAIETPAHARGEYRAKITREARPNEYHEKSQRLLDSAARYASTTDSQRRNQISREIHVGVLADPVTCVSCHAEGSKAIDFAALGYSPRRTQALSNLQIASLMQRIRQGEKFYLPKLLGDQNEK